MRHLVSFSRQTVTLIGLLIIALFVGLLFVESIRTDDAPVIIRQTPTPPLLDITAIPVTDFSTPELLIGTPTPDTTLYLIQPGDTLYGIALAYGTTIEAIVAANPTLANPNDLDVGQEIRLPSP